MSKQLVESIIDKNFVLAESHFNDRLSAIMEKKLYEKKRQVAADMDEAFGGLTKKEIEDRKKKGYVKASDVLQDPRDIKIPMRKKESAKRKKVSEEALDELSVGDVAKGVGHVAGKAIKTAGDVGYRVKRTYRLLRMKRHQAQSQQPTGDEDLRKTFGVERPEDKKRPGVIGRNLNTLMGRKPGYVKPETPEDEKGGNVGKAVRTGAKAGAKVAKAAFSLF